MKPAVLAVMALLCAPLPALATWSVIAVDRATGRVVIASATCVDRDGSSPDGSTLTIDRLTTS